MAEAKHTRGPWRLVGNSIYAEVPAPAEGSADALPWVGCVPVDRRVSARQRRANARGMAAVPDMIAALEVVRTLLTDIATQAGDDHRWNEGGRGRVAARQVRAALAKAGRK